MSLYCPFSCRRRVTASRGGLALAVSLDGIQPYFALYRGKKSRRAYKTLSDDIDALEQSIADTITDEQIDALFE